MNMGKELAAYHNRVLGDLLGIIEPAENGKEFQKSPKAPCPQVPLSELEKVAREFETRKMMLFGQGCKGTGLNPISITDGSPSPSDLISSTRCLEAEVEAENDDLDDALVDFDDYADAAHGDAEAELEGEGSVVNLNYPLEKNDDLFGSVDCCFRTDRSDDDFEKVFVFFYHY
ncbi:hypothetical protein LINPERPRIM_LOCUS36968 [Linum perenne]